MLKWLRSKLHSRVRHRSEAVESDGRSRPQWLGCQKNKKKGQNEGTVWRDDRSDPSLMIRKNICLDQGCQTWSLEGPRFETQSRLWVKQKGRKKKKKKLMSQNRAHLCYNTTTRAPLSQHFVVQIYAHVLCICRHRLQVRSACVFATKINLNT